MSYTLQVSNLAEADLAGAITWYARIRPGLAADFLLCADEAIDRIMHNPHAYAPLLHNVRRALLRRFPYSILYRVTQSRVTIEAFFPTRMDPTALSRRLA